MSAKKPKAKPKKLDDSGIRSILTDEFIEWLDEKSQDARDFKMTPGQWQDLMGEIQMLCARSGRDAVMLMRIP